MGKASKRQKAAGRKRKLDQDRHPNGRVSHAIGVNRMKKFVDDARERKAAVTGRADLPDDVLGILFGHRRIDDAEYNIGRKYQALAERIYGAPTGGPSAMFKESITPMNDEDAESKLEPMSDEEAEKMFMAMDATLRRCGLKIHNVTVAAIRYSRYPQTVEQVAWVVQGLERLAEGRVPKSDSRAIVVDRADDVKLAVGYRQPAERVHYQHVDETVARVEGGGEGVRVVEMRRVARAAISRGR